MQSYAPKTNLRQLLKTDANGWRLIFLRHFHGVLEGTQQCNREVIDLCDVGEDDLQFPVANLLERRNLLQLVTKDLSKEKNFKYSLLYIF